MRGNTHIVIGMKNVGNSGDTGAFFEGTVKDSILWYIQRIGALTMAKRFDIVITRTMGEARYELLGEGKSRKQENIMRDDIQALLDSIVDGETDDEFAEGTGTPIQSLNNSSSLDDYKD